MAIELELKLRCTKPLTWAEIQKAIGSVKGLVLLDPAVPAFSTKKLTNTYFDTCDLALNRNRVALRIRCKNGEYIQTLKTAGESVNGIHQRGEWEWVLSKPQLDLELMRKLPVFKSLETDIDLYPVFTTDFTRHACRFDYAGYRFELAFDQGEVRASSSQGESLAEPIEELEIEFLGESNSSQEVSVQSVHDNEQNESLVEVADTLHKLREVISASLPLEFYDESKAERGYALYQKLSRL